MNTPKNLSHATWELTLIIGVIAVLAFALVMFTKSIFKDGNIFDGIKRMLAMLWRNLS